MKEIVDAISEWHNENYNSRSVLFIVAEKSDTFKVSSFIKGERRLFITALIEELRFNPDAITDIEFAIAAVKKQHASYPPDAICLVQ